MESYNNLFKLSIAERLLLLEKLWDSIPANKIAVTKAQKAELNKRLARLEKGETKFFTWDEVKKNLHQK
jgi:putative addiction module component (TIGR02574 family)